MSGTNPLEPGVEREVLAAEYVLGTLTAYEAALITRALLADAPLAEAVAAWERRLAPLTELAVPEAPPPELWSRIEARIAPQLRTASRLKAGADASWRMRLLGGWAFGATVVAAMLGTFILVRGEPGPASAPVMTVMLSDRTQSAWTASVEGGVIRLAAIPGLDGTTPPPPENRALQLWALPAGETVPTSLGLLPPGQRRITVQTTAITPAPGMLIEITSEPPGGSPTGRPTGPVLFIGRMSQVGPDT